MATIQDVRPISPQRNYEWEIEIVGLSTGSNENLKFHAQSVSIPETSSETIEIPFKANRSFHSGRDSSGHTFSATFFENENSEVMTYFQNWHDNLIVNPTTGGGVAREGYVADVIIRTLATDSETETSRYLMSKSRPSTIGEITLNYDSSEHMTVEITFTFEQKLKQL